MGKFPRLPTRRLSFGGLLAIAALVFTALSGPPAAAQTITIEDTLLTVMMPDGRKLTSPDLTGAKLSMRVSGALRKLLIQSARSETVAGNTIWFHELDDVTDAGKPMPVCMPDYEGRRLAIFLAEPGPGAAVKITCTSGAEGKCMRFGYLPWQARTARQHAACIHMVIAGYRGDGHATTRDATMIDVWDDVPVQKRAGNAGFEFEAGWDEKGAVCVNHARIAENVDIATLTLPREPSVIGPACTEAEARRLGAILFNSSKPQ